MFPLQLPFPPIPHNLRLQFQHLFREPPDLGEVLRHFQCPYHLAARDNRQCCVHGVHFDAQVVGVDLRLVVNGTARFQHL